MEIRKNVKTVILFIAGPVLALMAYAVNAITPAQTPLYIGISSAKPNIMLMVDNSGSMSSSTSVGESAPESPNAVTGSYSTSCRSSRYYSNGSATAAAATSVITMQVFSGKAKFCPSSGSCTSGNSTHFGNSRGKKCFKTSTYYNVSGLGVYLGSELNKFFNKYNGSFNGSLGSIAGTTTRLAVVKEAAASFVNTMRPEAGASPTVRMGLSRYYAGAGGELLVEIGELDDARATRINDAIAGFSANSTTPLAETLSDIGRYFATGYNGNLELHPGTANASTASVDAVFNNHSIRNSTGSVTLEEPILGECQKSSVIILSDGLPSSDRDISTYLQDYDGDCSGSNSGLCTSYDMKRAYPYPGGNGGNPNLSASGGGSSSSDYLDDVAQALYDIDLRPDYPKTGGTKNNVSTYTVGFADPAVDPSQPGVNPLLSDTATSSGGRFVYAESTTTLADALSEITDNIISKVSSSSSVVANSARLEAGASIYQGKFDTADWTGSLSMLTLGATEDVNGNGVLDTGEDTNNNGRLDGGTVETVAWNAAELIPNHSARSIYTYNPTGSVKGIAFLCTNLTASQKTELGISDCSSSTDQGVWRLDYIRGDWTHEEINPNRSDPDTIRSPTAAADRIFRNRTHLDKNTLAMVAPDPWLLGDIVNSNPAYVSNEDYGYASLSGSEGSSYHDFLVTNASRRKMVYVGANDGMLHAFDASATGADAGKEIFAYIPNAVYGDLSLLSSPGYIHQYTVDGSPRVADAYFGSAWHTVLLGSTGAGGKAVFALDVTDPSNFGVNNVLWEVSTIDSASTTDLNSDSSSLRGFANNMGFSLPQPSIVKMNDGSWAAIVANGYGSVNNLAVLYIINVQTGAIIAAIDTKAGGGVMENGLSTPIAVDLDEDRVVDAIYAGDLLGNMWKFDVSASNANQWKVAYGTPAGPQPLFVACSDQVNCSTTRQPITGKPQVSAVGDGQSGGVMVYFGTGKYFEAIDNNVVNAQTQTLYGIWDNNATVARSDLQIQTITNEVSTGDGLNLRITSNNTVDYSSQKGWYLDLLRPSAATSDGERIISVPLLRNGRIVITTLTPIPPSNASDICGISSDGTSWLLELDALSGSRLANSSSDNSNGSPTGGPPWDITGDGIIDESDLITIGSETFAPSGRQSTVGITGIPGVVSAGELEYKYTSGSRGGQIEVITEQGSSSSTGSRQSWRQL